MLFTDAVVASPAALALVAGWVALVTPRLIATDLAEHRLPNSLVMPGWLVAVAALGVAWLERGVFPAPTVLLVLTALVVGVVLGLTGAVGMGDAKLAVPLSAALGLHGDGRVVLWLAALIVLAGVGALVHLLRTRDRGARIPLGPALLLGFWFAYVA